MKRRASYYLRALLQALTLGSVFFGVEFAEAIVKQCEKHGKNIICVKDIAAAAGDSFGRVGIINKSTCSLVRFTKQEWSLPCETLSRKRASLVRAFPGEVLKYGDFQVGMVQERITPGGCGEMRLLECYCGYELEPVHCSEVLWAATYKRGEHVHLLQAFNNYQRYRQKEAEEAHEGTDCDKKEEVIKK